MSNQLTPEEKNHFWSKVDVGNPGDCWNWKGSCNTGGYGQIAFKGTSYRCHRLAYELTNGKIPEGLCVRHFECDNPRCCNPHHFKLGTGLENIADRQRKGRAARLHGSSNGNARLSDVAVIQIRDLCKRGVRQRSIAGQFHISQQHVSRLIRGIRWSSI